MLQIKCYRCYYALLKIKDISEGITMKNGFKTGVLFLLAAAFLCACGKKADVVEITVDNVDDYIESFSNYEGLDAGAEKEPLTDEIVEYYADFYYERLCEENPCLKDENGNNLPLTDKAIASLNSEVYSNVSEYMVFIRGCVSDFLVSQYENEVVENVIKEVISSSKFKELPKDLIKNEEETVIKAYEEVAASYGLKVEKYLEYCGTSLEEEAKDSLLHKIVIVKIAKDKEIKDTEDKSQKEAVFDYILSVTGANDH